jgi:hypothetical protein
VETLLKDNAVNFSEMLTDEGCLQREEAAPLATSTYEGEPGRLEYPELNVATGEGEREGERGGERRERETDLDEIVEVEEAGLGVRLALFEERDERVAAILIVVVVSV